MSRKTEILEEIEGLKKAEATLARQGDEVFSKITAMGALGIIFELFTNYHSAQIMVLGIARQDAFDKIGALETELGEAEKNH